MALGGFCLLCNVGEVKELVESPRDRDQCVVIKCGQDSAQFVVIANFSVMLVALPVSLSEQANFLDLVKKPLAVLVRHGLAKYCAKASHTMPQAFGYQLVHRRNFTPAR